MDRLITIFEKQRKFNRNFITPSVASEAEKLVYTKDMLLSIVSEVDELLRSTGQWKAHRKTLDKLSRSGILEEGVDIFKFLLNILLTYGVTAPEFSEAFMVKSWVVEERFRWEQVLAGLGTKDLVAAVDIDGVLARYPENWISFLNAHLDLDPKLNMEDTKGPIWFPRVSRAQYYSLKHHFRELGGESFTVGAMPRALELMVGLKEVGFKLILLSARPYKKYKRILPDTLRWLQVRGIPFDVIIWDHRKHLRVLEQVPFLKFMVEDDPRVALQVAELGCRCYLLDRPYNQGVVHSNIVRVSKLTEILTWEIVK